MNERQGSIFLLPPAQGGGAGGGGAPREENSCKNILPLRKV